MRLSPVPPTLSLSGRNWHNSWLHQRLSVVCLSGATSRRHRVLPPDISGKETVFQTIWFQIDFSWTTKKIIHSHGSQWISKERYLSFFQLKKRIKLLYWKTKKSEIFWRKISSASSASISQNYVDNILGFLVAGPLFKSLISVSNCVWLRFIEKLKIIEASYFLKNRYPSSEIDLGN